MSWSSHSDLCEAVWSSLTLQSDCLHCGFHVDMDILFSRCYVLHEQHISIRNIDGCYFLTVEEQAFLLLNLKLVRFALTATGMLSVQLGMLSRPVLTVIWGHILFPCIRFGIHLSMQVVFQSVD